MKWPETLRDEARDEAYAYFDKEIRPLPKTPEQKIDVEGPGLSDNDVDAFRHAYVSGVFTQEYGEKAAETFGLLNEWSPGDLYSNSRNPGGKNLIRNLGCRSALHDIFLVEETPVKIERSMEK